MELQFDITRRFEKDLKRLSKDDQRRIAISIDRHAAAFDPDQGNASTHIYQPQKLVLPEGMDSSLYVLRATDRLRIILTIENDPLFGRKLITLIRVIGHNDLDRAFNSIAESLYQEITSWSPR
jgi:mRNA-degrading endonuclease RelE of RelBE toxin-antitoxin system